ncbi:MAG TPA: hypothetical protein VFH56_16090 [Acidimicrobiales bacterium]|nr:hypothetical protein [Acidimicrobiales bacterium]
MSDFFDDEYDDEPVVEQPNTGGPKALRDAYEREKEARKALEDRLAALEQADRKAKLASALKETGITNPDALGDFANLIEPDKAVDFVSAVKAAMGLAGAEPEQQGVDPETAAAVAAVSGQPDGGAGNPAPAGSIEALQGINDEAEFWKTVRGQ